MKLAFGGNILLNALPILLDFEMLETFTGLDDDSCQMDHDRSRFIYDSVMYDGLGSTFSSGWLSCSQRKHLSTIGPGMLARDGNESYSREKTSGMPLCKAP